METNTQSVRIYNDSISFYGHTVNHWQLRSALGDAVLFTDSNGQDCATIRGERFRVETLPD
jgi:hypothetical protein